MADPHAESLPEFEDDVAYWGRTQMEDEYYESEGDTDAPNSLSSGLSPRDLKPRLKPWDYEEGYRALAYNSAMYGKAQAMRRDGHHPHHSNMGMADDLPSRLATQQLNALAGMSQKVALAIQHSRKMLERQSLMRDRALKNKVFRGWRGVRFGSVATQNKIRKAMARIQRGTLSRAFFTWRDDFGKLDKYTKMMRKCKQVLAKGLLKRAFAEWVTLVRERWWKNQFAMRDNQIHHLETEYKRMAARPIYVMNKRRQRRVLQEWFGQSEARIAKRNKFARAGRHFQNNTLSKAWTSWLDGFVERKAKVAFLRRVVMRINNLKVSNAFGAWTLLVGAKAEKEAKVSKGLAFWRNSQMGKAFARWGQFHDTLARNKKAVHMWKAPMLTRAFGGWNEHVQFYKEIRPICVAAAARVKNRALSFAFETWCDMVDEGKHCKLVDTKEEMAIKLTELAAENERLRRDNERFVRLIDSGEWGRGRVQELAQAGEILKGERDALMKLIHGLRHEYESVQAAKANQEAELRGLKEKLVLGGAARNRMLIKGGSSFNGLMRALKQDVIESGAPVLKDRNLLYEVDKLSLERVQVFPDGELNVQAMARDEKKGPVFLRQSPQSPGPVHKIRTPTALRSSATSPNRSRPMQSPATGRPTSGHRPGSAHAGSPQHQQPPRTASPQHESVLGALQSLSPSEVDRLERALRQDQPQAAAAGTRRRSSLNI
ncbi:hypothetical protein WJX72_001787 [[Myrmecia] bisecta]|uniref:Uncharacterized protein n=1 Tax=[Myrmecia] bisecta TaxID=41462 RepID=A0AAW1Q3X6_9CHLO